LQDVRGGFRFRMFNNRPAMERHLCRICLPANEEMRRVWTAKREDCLRQEQEAKGTTNFYDHWMID
jgi:hypothetical protein